MIVTREWYRNPVLFIGWLLLVLTLIALIAYGINELIRGDQDTGHTPSTSTPSIAPTATTTPPEITSVAPPPTSSAVESPTEQPTQQSVPQQQPPRRHHHLPHLLPPGLR